MAAAVGSNNIYPPIVSPFSPNFVIDSEKQCRVYFSISAYNSISDYKDIHITVTRQSDNITALDKEDYPSKIMIKQISDIKLDETRQSVDKYYITLVDDDIEGGWQTGIVYKVQMRFSSNASGKYKKPQAIDDYLTAHLSAFSEWSQVCLVQGINQPELQIKNGKGGLLVTGDNNIFNVDTLEVVGTLITNDSDPLRQYELKLINQDDELVESSGVLFPPYQSNADQLNYVFKHALVDGEAYTLEVSYMTYGLYEETIKYPIYVVLNLIEQLPVEVNLIEDMENGRIGVDIKSKVVSSFTGTITIRRTSSKSNFQIWEDVHTTELRVENLNYLWYDYTIESGVWYRYCVQKRDSMNNRGIITKSLKDAMIIFDHMFLDADGLQLKIAFDPDITGVAVVVNDTKVDTIGDKYPHIMRNGATYYKQFQIGGLISFIEDNDKLFASREEFYSEEVLDKYEEYNKKNRIDMYNDIVYEKDFRDKVMTFLNKHNVKMFRSATEGNLLVKLMNISFTPNKTLGRRIYSFTCQAYEVADFTIENCNYYNVQPLNSGNSIEPIYEHVWTGNGQWDSVIPAGAEFIHSHPDKGEYSILEQYYKKDERDNYTLSVSNLDFLRIEIYDKPYLIADSGNGPVVYDDIPKSKIATIAAQGEPALYLGYIAYINDKTIVIPKDGIYELKGKDIVITSLKFAKDTEAEIKYHANVVQTEKVAEVTTITNFSTHLGQQWGAFIPGESLYNDLWAKYYMEHPGDYYNALVSINGIRVEANPGTVVYVREEGENLAERHVIGPTESLDFFDPDSVIADAYFLGAHFEQATDYEMDREILPEGKFNKTNIVVDNLDKIENPKDRNVYYLQASNMGISTVAAAAIQAVRAPEMVTLITAKGLPIFYFEKQNIAIIDKKDLEELHEYLDNVGYKIYTTDSILFSDEQEIKVAENLDSTDAFEFILDTAENKSKLAAFKVILDQYGDNYITAALKRQIWKDISYNVSDYYIYFNQHWFVFDESTNDAICPVPASIDYLCETIKAYYRDEG